MRLQKLINSLQEIKEKYGDIDMMMEHDRNYIPSDQNRMFSEIHSKISVKRFSPPDADDFYQGRIKAG